MITILGVDPGSSGGFAWRYANGDICAVPMPATQGDILQTIAEIHEIAFKRNEKVICYMEQLPLFVGGADIPGSRIGVMFEGYGFTKGVIQTLGIPLVMVTPQKWQKSLGLGKIDRVRAEKGATDEQKKAVRTHNAQAKRDWKNKLRSECQRRYPSLKITLAKADAILVMDYGLREQRIEVKQPSELFA